MAKRLYFDLTCRDRIIRVQHSHYHGCWYPGSLPGHQDPWYWLCRIGKFLSCTRKDFNYLCHANVEEWHKLQLHFYVSGENSSTKKGGPIMALSTAPYMRHSASMTQNKKRITVALRITVNDIHLRNTKILKIYEKSNTISGNIQFNIRWHISSYICAEMTVSVFIVRFDYIC